MKASNPFQVSSSNPPADCQRGRRWFRNGFLMALGAHVVLFLVLLIQGCRNQPAQSPTHAARATPSAAPAQAFYTVKSGDTLARIAKLRNTTIEAIRKSNNLEDNHLVVGMKLKIASSGV